MSREYSQSYSQISRNTGVVFDPSETPFTFIRPDLSSLGESPVFTQRLRTRFPMLNFSQACIVDGAIIIQDVSPLISTTETVEALNYSSDITLQVVDAKSASDCLSELLTPYRELIKNALVVFPGEGAKTMRQFMKEEPDIQTVFLPTKRTLIRPGEFNLAINYSSLPATTDASRVIIFDDVVATGQTATTVARRLRRLYPNITECVVATWIMVEPRSNTTSGLKGIDRVFTSIVAKGNYVKQPPINSLSCFVRNDRKYEPVKNAFMQKYIRDIPLFKRILQELGGDRV